MLEKYKDDKSITKEEILSCIDDIKELENEGLVERVAEENSCRLLYKLTEQGEDLSTIMKEVHNWSNKWYTAEDCQ